ncbi:MAG: two-component sensor histidine kinase, partial [Propionibacterium sp.]
MTTNLLLSVAATLVVGVLLALITLRVARHSILWASLLSPVSVVVAMASGLLLGAKLMVIEGVGQYLLILLATALVALVIGGFVSVGSNRLIAEKNAELERVRRLREVDEGRRELLTWMSHDIRTPLAGIRAMAEALEDGIAADPRRYYQAIVSEAERTTEMVSDLMSLARLQSGAMAV